MSSKPIVYTRQELYDLVWSEPMRTLAAKYGLTDSGLAKACRKHDIPLPPRGYWAKASAGKKATRTPFRPRGLGMPDKILIGGSRWYYPSSADFLQMEVPPEPVYEENLAALSVRVASLVARAKVASSLSKPHPSIAKLLEADQKRCERRSWERPLLDDRFEKRRLTFLNKLFSCLAQCQTAPSVSGTHAREIRVQVGEQTVGLSLDSAKAHKQMQREAAGYAFATRGANDKLCLSISAWNNSQKELRKSWGETEGKALADRVRETATEIIIAGELGHRAEVVWHRNLIIERKAEAEKVERELVARLAREEHERVVQMERERFERLLSQAAALRQAMEIRAYVEQMREATRTEEGGNQREEWALWALDQADRIDPVRTRKWASPGNTGKDGITDEENVGPE